MKYSWEDLGLHIPRILLPLEGTDYYRWAVVACDQFTSEPEYWKKAEEIVGDAPSTLRLMLPEYYLGKPEEEKLTQTIHETMEAYQKEGILKALPAGCMLVRREAEGRSRLGLVIAVDLEAYDYNKGSGSLIRATEGTILNRIPPRLKIRRGAPIEMPHILILIDDPDRSCIEPLEQLDGTVMYDTDLMLDGGHITGKFLPEEKLDGLLAALNALMEKAVLRYGEGNVIFEAMGDGNHSLATAKTAWEEIKKNLTPEQAENHPARYALCEIENVHDEGIVFEPIHRVVFGKNEIGGNEILDRLVAILNEQNGSASLCDSAEAEEGDYAIPCLAEGKELYLIVKNPAAGLPVGTLQNAIDVLIKEEGLSVDYIHGEKTVQALAADPHNAGFLLPAMDKFALFPAVVKDGALPRKTFSMGEANEKRYYMETRSIVAE